MLIRLDRQGMQQFRFRTETIAGGDIRRYYVARAPYRAILVFRHGLDFYHLIDSIVDARVGWDDGFRDFVRPGNEGQQHTKITIYRLARVQASPAPARTLSRLLESAPRDA